LRPRSAARRPRTLRRRGDAGGQDRSPRRPGLPALRDPGRGARSRSAPRGTQRLGAGGGARSRPGRARRAPRRRRGGVARRACQRARQIGTIPAMTGRSRAVVSVIGRDQKGVVARVSTYLASCDINIEDIEQKVMEGLFIMTMLVDLTELSCTLDELVDGLKQIGGEINMEVKLRLAGGTAEPKRVAVLVTKEPHCLEQLVRDPDAGLLNGELALVLSNHEVLEGVARAAGIPFAWSSSADKAAHFDFLIERLGAVKPDLVVLARYMQVLTPKVIERYPFRIINIHPSL